MRCSNNLGSNECAVKSRPQVKQNSDGFSRHWNCPEGQGYITERLRKWVPACWRRRCKTYPLEICSSQSVRMCNVTLLWCCCVPGSWEDMTSQFVRDCDHSQVLFDSTDSDSDVWNHGFTILAVLYASLNCNRRLFTRSLFITLYFYSVFIYFVS